MTGGREEMPATKLLWPQPGKGTAKSPPLGFQLDRKLPPLPVSLSGKPRLLSPLGDVGDPLPKAL